MMEKGKCGGKEVEWKETNIVNGEKEEGKKEM